MGVEHASPAVHAVAVAYNAAVKAQREALAQNLQVGDEIIAGGASRASKGDAWVAVETIEVTDRESGSNAHGPHYYRSVTTSDGRTLLLGANQIIRRRANIAEIKAEAVSQADAAYAAELAR